MSNFHIEIPYKGIHIYRGAFKNPENFIERVLKTSGWEEWYIFGKKLNLVGPRTTWSSFPDEQSWNHDLISKISDEYSLEVCSIFYKVTKNYIETNNIEQPNWSYNSPSLCKYEPLVFDERPKEDIIMQYHTDFELGKAEQPGDKFGITCTMYLNDDYEGGELSFKIYEDEDYVQIDIKPRKGDIIVFPSGLPYYHGVKKVVNKPKYFIRSFWFWNYAGSKTWLDNQKKYGKEVWSKMEDERWNKERISNVWIANNKGNVKWKKSF